MPGFAYVGKHETGMDLIHLLADGDRPVLEVYVNSAGKIFVNGVGRPVDDMQLTKGEVHFHEHEGQEIVCPNAFMSYMIPRMHTLMARVYVPVETEIDMSGISTAADLGIDVDKIMKEIKFKD